MTDSLDAIARKLLAKELILFVGSGMSAGCYPTWRKLLEELIEKHLEKNRKAKAEAKKMLRDKQYLNAAWVIQDVIGEDLHIQLADKFERKSCLTVEARYKHLVGLPFKAIFTTNYDHFLNGIDWPPPITQQDDLGAVLTKGRVLKLHGCQSRDNTMVLTSQDFSGVKFNPKLTQIMETAATAHSFLFVGYSMEDEDVMLWLERSCHLGGRTAQPRHFALVNGTKWGDYKRRLYAKRYSIQIVDAPLGADGYPDIAGFLDSLRGAWHDLAPKPANTKKVPLLPTGWKDEERNQYVDPQVRLTTAPENAPPQSLDRYIDGWLKDDRRQLLVILGEFGTGKTWSAYRIHDRTSALTKRTPVLIRLGEFREGADVDAIAKKVCGDAASFVEANGQGELVVILDAFDEMGKPAAKKLTLDDSFEQLRKLVAGEAKVVITCRKEFFRDEREERRALYREFDAAHGGDHIVAKGVEKVEVQHFDPVRIQEALTKRKCPEIYGQIRGHAGLMDLASRPVLLNLITGYRKPLTDKTRRVDLYEDYIPQLLMRGENSKERYSERREFVEKLAWEIQQSGAGSLPVEEVERLGRELFPEDFDTDSDLFLGRTLLVRHERSHLTFGHASFREYLVAKQILPYLQKGEYKACKLSNPTIEFLREMWSDWRPGQRPAEKDGMVLIPKGPFICGEGDSARVENLEQDVWMDKDPVTNAEFAAFLDSGEKIDPEWFKEEQRIRDPKRAKHPVVYVSWHGAAAYASWKRKRLPTDIEWEKAARGVDGRQYPWGDEFKEDRCNTRESGLGGTSPVDRHLAAGESPYGCREMAGNVWEWVLDDHTPGEPYKSLRGGPGDGSSSVARCAFRSYSTLPEYRINVIGFRCSRASS